MADEVAQNASSLNSISPSKELPLVLLNVSQPAAMTVQVGSSKTSIPLADFVKGTLSGELFWAEARPGRSNAELQVASISCWTCHSLIKVVRGYIINDEFISLAEISDTDAVAAVAEKLRRQDSRVTPVSRRYSETRKARYFAATCPFYSALIGNFFMTADFYDRRFLHEPGVLRVSQL